MFIRSARPRSLTAGLVAALGVGALAVSPPALGDDGDAATWSVTQPGPAAPGELTADVTLDDGSGTLSLSIHRGDATVLEPSPLGIVADDADLTSGLTLLERTDTPVSESYTRGGGQAARADRGDGGVPFRLRRRGRGPDGPGGKGR